jgi:hypothetical protein
MNSKGFRSSARTWDKDQIIVLIRHLVFAEVYVKEQNL